MQFVCGGKVMSQFRFPVTGQDKIKLIKRTDELRERGFELLTPIKPIYKNSKTCEETGKQFRRKNKLRNFQYVDSVTYGCWMGKID